MFFILYYLFIYYYINPRLLYFANDVRLPRGEIIEFPFFLWGWDYFREFALRPGGLVEYISAMGSQYYFYAGLGPLILALLAFLSFIFTDGLLRATGNRNLLWLRFAPPLILLVVFGRYTYRIENCLAPIVALGATTAYVVSVRRIDSSAVRLLLFAIIANVLYLAVGGPFLLFAAWCAAYELIGRWKFFLGGVYLLLALCIPFAGMHLFDIGAADAYLRPAGLFAAETTAFELYNSEPVNYYKDVKCVRPATIAGFYLFFAFLAVFLSTMSASAASRGEKPAAGIFSGRKASAWGLLSLAAVFAGVMWLAPDRDVRTILQANYYARNEMWPELLDVVERYPPGEFTPSLTLDINRALFETGQMGDRLFAYPQSHGLLLLSGPQAMLCKGGRDLLLALGRVNEAEHAAMEALEITGPRPETLRLLAIVFIAKHRPETARAFLETLGKDIVHGSWARERLKRLRENPQASNDPHIEHIRSIMPQKDMVINSNELRMLALLARNPENRMALEYLLAYYLFQKQVDKIACTIIEREDIYRPTIPEHYSEAILLYSYNTRKKLDLAGRAINPRVVERVREAIDLTHEHYSDQGILDSNLAKKFPGSALRYLCTSKSGDRK